MDFTAFTDSSTSFTALNSMPLGEPESHTTQHGQSSRYSLGLHGFLTRGGSRNLAVALFYVSLLLANATDLVLAP